MEKAVQTFGGIDIAVLNAGVGMHHFFHKTHDLSVFRQLMDINFFGT
jgi:NAD(P)-dependent dehydrogenase (short-subunit alcohol dehydrogenase family)